MSEPKYSDSMELKEALIKWANQIGNFCDGCCCASCMGHILEEIQFHIKGYTDKTGVEIKRIYPRNEP